jgi:hypothetical protein
MPVNNTVKKLQRQWLGAPPAPRENMNPPPASSFTADPVLEARPFFVFAIKPQIQVTNRVAILCPDRCWRRGRGRRLWRRRRRRRRPWRRRWWRHFGRPRTSLSIPVLEAQPFLILRMHGFGIMDQELVCRVHGYYGAAHARFRVTGQVFRPSSLPRNQTTRPGQ